ncbi:fibroblast growth factor 18b [Carassius carassius]|uniref:fibroblast growth factor 18b n=1 Tax=Carassius carassius TaxID=217509 RepID=UPI0028689294|nr:fibroblast growth factor 18b [Carassius carassius]
MQSMLSSAVVLCFQVVLQFYSPLQVLAVENVNFGVHVENQTGVRDGLSRKHHRVYQLYSRTSGKHIQVLGKKITAMGEDGDKYAQLVVEADTFGSQVRIRGKETNYYLCMNRKGKLVGKKDSSVNGGCIFIEIMLENNYTAWMSARYVGWYIGFTKRGRPRRGPNTLPNQRDVHFMKRFPPGEQPDLQACSFTTVSKRSKRVQQTSTAPPALQ